MRSKRIVPILGCCVALWPLAALAQPVAPARDVVVRNTPAEAVPTTAVGTTPITGDVVVTNTPAVNARQDGPWLVEANVAGSVAAQQAGAWSVSVNGGVTVANPASQPVPVAVQTAAPLPVVVQGTASVAGAVTVTNTPSVQLAGPVASRDAAARDLHFEYVDCVFDAATLGGRMCTGTLSLPEGKRFVVKAATFFLPLPGATAAGEIVGWTGRGFPNSWHGSIDLVSPLNGYLWARHELTLYADPQRNGSYGVRVHCTASVDASPRTCSVQLYGYLVDCAAAPCNDF